jgi:hypothetical protein
MRKPCAFTLLLFLLTASNCFAVKFNQIEIYSSNWGETTWLLGTDVMLNEAVSATLNYYVDTDGPYPMPLTSVFGGTFWLYLDDTTPRYPGKIPTDFNGRTFTWTVADTGNNLYATGVASGIRRVPLSTGLTFSGDPYHPTISWSNSDPALDDYNIRLFDASGALLGQWAVPLSSNPSFTFNGYTFELGKTYKIRVEARDFVYFDLVDDSANPLSLHAQILNRSNLEISYTVGVSFNHLEVYSNNDAELGWLLGTACILNHPFAPMVAYSVASGGFNPMSRVTIPYYQSMYLYNASVTDQVGGSPADYNGSTLTWGVDDSPNDLSATASISSGIRQVALSTNLAVTGNHVHPTVSWYNPDPDLDYYRVGVTDGSGNMLWQSSDLKFSSYGANPSYTINGFTFKSGNTYRIRIEAREYLNFPFAEGSSIPTSPSTLLLVNRSTVYLPYIFVSKDELILNFGSTYGLWRYDQTGGFKQWNTVNPSQMVTVDLNGDGTDELVAAFPGYGLYTYDSTDGWLQINTFIPEVMGAGRNFIACDYGAAYGLWLWDRTGGWQQINTVKPDKMIAVDIDGDGQDELVASFTGYGLYSYDDPGVWTQINTVMPDVTVRHSNGLVCDYGATYGLWFYNQAGGWKQWNTVNPTQMVTVDLDGDGTEELVAAFPGYGLYTYDSVGGNWQQINTVIPDAIIRQGNGIAANYGAAYGLWNWSQGGGWKQRNTVEPGQMLSVDINKDGVEELVVSFAGYGLYYYDEAIGWQLLNSVLPEDMKAINFNP